MNDPRAFNQLMGSAITERIRELSSELIQWIAVLEKLESEKAYGGGKLIPMGSKQAGSDADLEESAADEAVSISFGVDGDRF